MESSLGSSSMLMKQRTDALFKRHNLSELRRQHAHTSHGGSPQQGPGLYDSPGQARDRDMARRSSSSTGSPLGPMDGIRKGKMPPITAPAATHHPQGLHPDPGSTSLGREGPRVEMNNPPKAIPASRSTV